MAHFHCTHSAYAEKSNNASIHESFLINGGHQGGRLPEKAVKSHGMFSFFSEKLPKVYQ